MDVKYVLVWECGGLRKHYVNDKELFIGRLPATLSRLNHSYTPFKVYIYYPKTLRTHYTGINSSVVSRLHAKLVVGDDGVLIMDHGPEGKGSRNGLIVNESLLPKGSSAKLAPGSSFRLGYSGPLFTLLAETPSGTQVLLDEGIPSVMPESLARELSGSGLSVTGLGRGEAAVIALRRGVIKVGPYVVRVEGLGEGERLLKALLKLQCRVSEAVELVMKGRIDDALNLVKSLRLKVFEDAVKSLGDEGVISEYEWLIKIAEGGLTDESLILERLRRLRSMIEDAVLGLD